jgi:LacI family transcriptional regulator
MERRTDALELLDGQLDDPIALAANLRDLRRVNRWLGGIALSAAGIEAPPDWLRRTVNDVSHATNAAAELLAAAPRPTAIICATDIIAIGVRAYLERVGLKMGKDIAVTSYDDTPVAVALGLTSVHQDIATIAKTLTQILLAEIQGTPAANRRVLVEPSLIVRESSTG